MKGDYKLKTDIRARVGVSAFEMGKGAIIRVVRYDQETSKVLIDFGDGYKDWFSQAWLKKYAEFNKSIVK